MPSYRHAQMAGARSSRRLPELDGLRGLAAVIVLFHHVVLTLPSVADVYVNGTVAPHGSLTWYLTRTPLHLLIAGPESVLVFFVLSGCVLALPVLRSPRYDWVNYYASRTLRLGLPAAGAVLLATGLRLLAPLPAASSSSWLQMAQVPDFSWRNVFVSADLIGGDYTINNPMWSLRWEMIFSLALPIYIILAVSANTRCRRALLVAAVVMLSWVAGAAGNPTFTYLTVFLLGTIVACRLVRLPSVELPRGLLSNLGWFLAFAASALLLILPWLVGWAPSSAQAVALPPLGAMGLVWCTLRWRPLRGVLASAPFRTAGRYSFSLYLVHVPTIYLVVALLPKQPFQVVAPVTVGLAGVLAVTFYHLVESPSHRLARYAGQRAKARFTEFIADAQESAPELTSSDASEDPTPTGEPTAYAPPSARDADSSNTGIPPRTG